MPVEFDIAASGFAVRPAVAADVAACRMLLPALAGVASFVVAVDGRRGLVVGAAGLTEARRLHPVVGAGCLVQVIQPCRGHGIGSALRDALQGMAQARGDQALYAAQRCDVDGPEHLGWRRLGFAACETVEHHELPLGGFVQRLAPLIERMRRQGRIPPEARIVPLYAADPARVLQLHLDCLGGDRGSLYRRLTGRGDGAFHPRYSRILMLGEQVRGCVLAHRKAPHIAEVDAVIVHPELRGGWANPWLKLEATQGALSLGITSFHYTTFDQYADTRRFTAKLGGLTTRREALMYRPF